MGHLRTPAFKELVAALRAGGCVYAEEEAAILQESAGSAAQLARMLARRVDGQPLEHIVGWAEFDGFRVAVAPGVFVPRRRSVFLVGQAVAALAAGPAAPPVVVDLCCGSGALGVAVALRLQAGGLPACELHATDVDPVAVACAEGNLALVNGHACCGDLFAPLPVRLLGTVDVILANAPYVPESAIEFMPQEARLHEPAAALNGGADGLDLHRRIAAQAGQWLRPGGTVLLECSTGQAGTSAEILARHGLRTTIVHSRKHDATVVAGVAGATVVAGRALHVGKGTGQPRSGQQRTPVTRSPQEPAPPAGRP